MADAYAVSKKGLQEKLSNFLRASAPQPDTPLWSLWWVALLFWFVVFWISFIDGGLRRPSPNAPPPESFLKALVGSTPIIREGATLVGMYLFVTGLCKRPFLRTLDWNFDWTASLNLLGKRRTLPLATVILGLLSAILLIILISALTFIPGPETDATERLNNSTLLVKFAFSLRVVIVAPFVEELLYRGMLFEALQRGLNKAGAALVVVISFTTAHSDYFLDKQYNFNWGGLLSILAMSVMFTGLRAYTDRIAPAYFAHLGFNLYMAIALCLSYDPIRALFSKLGG